MRYFGLVCIALIGSLSTPSAFCQQIAVTGDAATPITISAADLAKMTHISGTVLEGDTVVTYQGVQLSEILKKAGVPFGGGIKGAELLGVIIAKGEGGKTVAFTYGEIDPDIGGTSIIVADQVGGVPITGEHGPLHLVVLTDRGNARFIDKIATLQLMHVAAK